MLSSVQREQRKLSCGIRAAIAAATMIVAAVGTMPASAKPERIVSMNLCTDQLVMLLADRERILSVSYLAADPQASALAGEVDGIPVNLGLAEEILPMAPDLILAGAFTTRPTVFLLRKLGYRVVELPVAENVDDVRANIRIVAEAIDEIERGEAMVAAIDDKLQRLSPDSGPRPLAVLYWANGYTSGSGTLANAAVEAAGFRTLGRELGLTGTGQLPLETLLAAEPDMLITGRQREGAALANENFRHPALRQAFAGRSNVSLPDYLWVCGTPFVADAILRLSAARESLRDERRGQAVDR